MTPPIGKQSRTIHIASIQLSVRNRPGAARRRDIAPEAPGPLIRFQKACSRSGLRARRHHCSWVFVPGGAPCRPHSPDGFSESLIEKFLPGEFWNPGSVPRPQPGLYPLSPRPVIAMQRRSACTPVGSHRDLDRMIIGIADHKLGFSTRHRGQHSAARRKPVWRKDRTRRWRGGQVPTEANGGNGAEWADMQEP